MTGKERLMRIFKGEAVDRPAIKLWGLSIGQKLLHPAYLPIYNKAVETTDIMDTAVSPFHAWWGAEPPTGIYSWDVPLQDGWLDRITQFKLGDRTFRTVYRYSTRGEPGYTLEHLVKEPGDLKAILSATYKPFPVDIGGYLDTSRLVGDRGIVTFGLDHAAYSLQRLMGSQCFALMCMDERDLMVEAAHIFGQRIKSHARAVLNTGIKPVFSWVGPELCIPLLVGMAEFSELVCAVDKPLCDLIHECGGYVWVHCHGNVGRLMKHFEWIGVDILNPIEPPPMGDVTLEQALAAVGNRMGVEGNIEIAALLLESPEHVRELVYDAVRTGSRSSRFVLCPSAGYMEYTNPSPTYLNNLMVYLTYGLDCVQKAGMGLL